MHSFDRKPYDACGFLQQLCEFSDILDHDIRRYLALFDIRFLRFSAHHQNAGNRTVIRYGDIRIQTIPDNGDLVCVKTGFLNDVFQCFRTRLSEEFRIATGTCFNQPCHASAVRDKGIVFHGTVEIGIDAVVCGSLPDEMTGL